MMHKTELELLGAKSNDRAHHCCIHRKVQIYQYAHQKKHLRKAIYHV